jgi:hypothetical protein
MPAAGRRGSLTSSRFWTEIAAAKAAPEFVRDTLDNEAARRRIDDEIARPGDGADQPADQAGRLEVRMDSLVDLFNPAIPNAVIMPGRLREYRRLLQNQQIVATAPAPVTVTEPPMIPDDQVDAFQDIINVPVISASEPKGIHPKEQVRCRGNTLRCSNPTSPAARSAASDGRLRCRT